MDRRRFLAALGFGAVAPAMVDPLIDNLLKEGLIAKPLELMEPVEKQEPLDPFDILKVYRATLKEMGVHNEAIDRMTGKWEELDVRRINIKKAKAAHVERIAQAQKAGKADGRRRRATRLKREIRRRMREARRAPKPKLP